MLHATTWIKLESPMLGESQTQKVSYYMIPFYEISKIAISIETGCQGLGTEEE